MGKLAGADAKSRTDPPGEMVNLGGGGSYGSARRCRERRRTVRREMDLLGGSYGHAVSERNQMLGERAAGGGSGEGVGESNLSA